VASLRGDTGQLYALFPSIYRSPPPPNASVGSKSRCARDPINWAFLDHFLLLVELSEHIPKMSPQLCMQHLPAALGNERHVVFALPFDFASRRGAMQGNFAVRARRVATDTAGDRAPLASGALNLTQLILRGMRSVRNTG
jgi:hypothetical protein